ncbi:hypothetical protein PQQ51_02535 [Paraburkholderia xenovorans]|uniref:hypothetical protein n=1 Tax=Paraburkholderia xenovorans TaxID=36873 RepID=UPI0038B8C386
MSNRISSKNAADFHPDLTLSSGGAPSAHSSAGRNASTPRSVPPALSNLHPASLKMSARFSHAVDRVQPQTIQNLRLSAQVVDAVEQYFPHGAGNQWPAVVHSEGESYARLHLTRGMKKEYAKQHPEMDRTFRNARLAATLQGANCGEMADTAYTYLAATGANAPVSRVSYQNNHEFVMLGDPRASTADTVVVDAWPHFAGATTLKNLKLDPAGMVIKKQRFESGGSHEAQQALSGIHPMTKAEVNQRIAAEGFPPIGPELLKDLSESLHEAGQKMFDERTLARDPSVQYYDGANQPTAFDKTPPARMTRKLQAVADYERAVTRNPQLFGDIDTI